MAAVAYVISAVEGFVDEATVRRYAEITGPAIEHFGGRFLVSNAEPAVVEGESPSGYLSMVEFPSIEHAKAWYDSPEYAEARALTPATFRGRVLMFVTPSTPAEREGLALSGNIEIITRFEHAFRAADQATIDELCDPGLVDHNPAPDEEPTLAGFKQKVAGFKASFPDLEEDLQDIIASGDTVATRWVVTGSQQQELMGIPASGQTIRVEGMNFYRLKDGRVTDIWTQFDGLALLQQLSAIPA